MPDIENSEVLEKVLTTLIEISGRKTTEGYAISVTDSLIKKLQDKYHFLEHVSIKDTRYLEGEAPVSVMSPVDAIPKDELGKAIYAIINTMNQSLGKDAGHFFIKELSRTLGDDYNSTMKEMGIDLNLMQLEHEVSELEKNILISKKK